MKARITDLESRIEAIRNHYSDYCFEPLYAYLFEAMTGFPVANFTAAIDATEGEHDGVYKPNRYPELAKTDYATYERYSKPF
jgi:hypothetical protein